MWNMDLTGLVNNIVIGASDIDKGRKNIATDGLEHAGRLFYERGILTALDVFKNAQISTDPQTMILVELTFLQQEFQFCNDTDTITRSSLTQAIQSFEDALRSLKTVEDSILYKAAETTYPTAPKYRYQGCPRDAIHLACAAHRTRLQNSLRTPGINMIEKTVITQRAANMTAIQTAYVEKQGKAMEK
jgi:hypothetical protein